MGCDPFESIEPYRLMAVTAATMSVHLWFLRVGLICSIWQQTSSRHVVRQRVQRRKWRQDVVCQWAAAERMGDRQREGGGYKERQAEIKQKKADFFNLLWICLIYNFITCYQWQNKSRAPNISCSSRGIEIEDNIHRTMSIQCGLFSFSQRIHMACVHWPGLSCSPARLAQIQLLLCL